MFSHLQQTRPELAASGHEQTATHEERRGTESPRVGFQTLLMLNLPTIQQPLNCCGRGWEVGYFNFKCWDSLQQRRDYGDDSVL